jgi:hypothetical protein
MEKRKRMEKRTSRDEYEKRFDPLFNWWISR